MKQSNNQTNIIHRILLRPWHITAPLITLGSTFTLAAFVPQQSTNIIVTSSAVMQAVGMCTLVIILNKNMSTLQGKSLLDDLKLYLTQLGKKPTKTAHISVGGFTLTGQARVVRARIRNPGVTEERLKAIEQELDSLVGELDGNTTRLSAEIKSNRKELEIRVQAVNELITTIDNKLQSAVVGDYRGQIFSIVMIVLGLLLSIPFIQSIFKQ